MMKRKRKKKRRSMLPSCNLRSLYKFSPEAKKKTPEKKGIVIVDPKESVLKKTKITIKPFKTVGVESEKYKQKVGEKPIDKEKELKKKRVADKPLIEPKETEVAAITLPEKAHGLEVVHITGLDQPIH
ncbi:hypothetical protein Hanom_Chr07g00649451 [Helianthus anomalus]